MISNRSKKLKIICSLVIFFAVALMPLGGVSDLQAQENRTFRLAPLNPDFVEFFENPPEHFYGYIPPPMDLSHLDEIPLERLQQAAALPSKFDWRDTGKVTSVKDQTPCGTCWIFGTTSVLESAVLIGENTGYDFSEQSVALCVDRSQVYLYDDADEPCGILPDHGGGSSLLASEVFIKKGAVSESCNPYNTGELQCDGTCGCDSCPPVKKVSGYRLVTNDKSQTSLIKEAVYNQGPVFMAFYYDAAHEYTHPTHGTVYDCAACSRINHGVSIIGWDDSVPHYETPGTGAWLVKNSWGTGWGNNGYFWLAYDSSCMTQIAYLKYKDYDPNEELYYWDEAGYVGYIGCGTPSAWMANIFTSTQSGSLTHVDFWTTSDNTEYDIYAYLDGNIADGLTNLACSQSGTCQELGYYSIPLSSPVSLTNGQTFTIAVKMTTPGFNSPIPVEAKVIQGVTTLVDPPIQTGKSFARCSDTGPWDDLALYECNACLRARVTSEATNNPPYAPSGPSPANHASGVSVNTDLSWTAGDPDAGDTVTYDVYLDTTKATTLVSEGQSGTMYDPGTLDPDTKYYWKIVAEDNHGVQTVGPVWDFTTGSAPNNPPNIPSSPSPANHATDVNENADLSWTGGDPDAGDTVTYDVYFGTSTPLVLVSDDQLDTTYDPGKLGYNTKYYWKIVAADNNGASTAGPLWDFTTGSAPNNPPNTPSNPSPADYSTGVDINANLSWTGGDPDPGDTVTYDVYFGTSSTPPLVSSHQSGTIYEPGSLAYNTKYYWKIVAWDKQGASTAGPLWDFTTGSVPNNPPNIPSNPSPANHATGVSIDADLSWTGGDPDPGDTVTYDVYFRNVPTPTLVSDDQLATTYDPGKLQYNTRYYWQVVATDSHGAQTTGPLWDFATRPPINNPPNTPSTPSPAQHATGTEVHTELSWTGGDPDTGDTVTYDVYFDDTGATTLISEDQLGTTCDPGTLDYNTKYYWKVVATDNDGASTVGPLWDFTTSTLDEPDISVSPISFDVTLPPDTIQNYALTISNDGGVSLSYDISDRDTTGGGSLASRESLSLLRPASMVLEVPLEGKPVELENAGLATTGWQNIMTDGFEGAFPGVWEVWVPSGATDAYWGDDKYRAHRGSHSAFCAKDGSAGVNPPGDYPSNMEAWMIYGPFSLEDAIDAELSFYYWLDSEYGYDYLWWGASIDGEMFYGYQLSGYIGGWASESLDLSRVPTLWNICGESQVWIAFAFESDDIVSYKGAFIDDVVLRKYVGAANNPPNMPSNPSPANHATSVSINADLSWSGGDPDPGDTVTYDVYFGTSTTPPLVSNDQSGTTYDPGTLNINAKYYWKIVATDNHGASTTGPLWDFTTGGVAGDCPWLDENPKSGSVPPGGSTDITVAVDTTGLANGDYSAEIVISSNDPKEPEVIIPVALHVGPLPDEPSPELGFASLIGEGKLVIAYNFDPFTIVPVAVNGWTWYDPTLPPLQNNLAKLHKYTAYWVKVTEECWLTYGSKTYHLAAGWNNPVWLGC